MKPQEPEKNAHQGDLFRSLLDQLLNHRHPLFVLANEIDWAVFDEEVGTSYVENVGHSQAPREIDEGTGEAS